MSIYKPKILIIHNSKVLLNKCDIYFDTLRTDDVEHAVKLAFSNMEQLSALIITDNSQNSDATLSLLRKLNNIDIFRTVPGIIITDNPDNIFMSKAFEYGIFDIVYEPAEFEFIRQKLYKVIEIFNNRKQLEKIFNVQTITISSQESELLENQWNIIETLGQALESRDVESGNHCRRMKDITESFCTYIAVKYPKYMLSESKVRQIVKVTPLHDIGKIAIPDSILLKPESAGRLTNEEFDIMKTHTVAGGKILDSIPKFKNSSLYQYSFNICRFHHERWDGKGYPDHLKGTEIPIEAQVVALADVFDALLSKRVYKPSFTIEKTKEMIMNGECGSFNPDIIECFEHCADDLYNRLYAKDFQL